MDAASSALFTVLFLLSGGTLAFQVFLWWSARGIANELYQRVYSLEQDEEEQQPLVAATKKKNNNNKKKCKRGHDPPPV